jgi:hypothetical protein
MVPTAVTVVPVSWSDHAYSEFGIRPQESLNKQLVDEADLAFAMFADRLGTPTGEADSGTVEEMNVMREAGKHVSIVRSLAPRAIQGADATAEKLRLEEYLSSVKAGRGLVYEYNTGEDLAAQVEHVLSSQAERFLQDTAAASSVSPSSEGQDDPSLGVWPTTEVVERPKTDSKGRLSTGRNWYLVLTNATGRPVKNVRYRYEDEDGNRSSFDLGADEQRSIIEVMAPGATQRFPILATMGSAPSAMCIVTWEDEAGEQETRATVMRA